MAFLIASSLIASFTAFSAKAGNSSSDAKRNPTICLEKKWVFGWQKKGFKDKKNVDLWNRFLKIFPKHNIKFIWIKGHNDHLQNERCDRLAVAASQQEKLLTDKGFEQKPKELF